MRPVAERRTLAGMTPDNTELRQLLERIEQDRTAEAGRPFLDLAAAYFSRSARADRPVAPARSADELAVHFAPPTADGASLESVVAGLAEVVDGGGQNELHVVVPSQRAVDA